MMTPLEQKRARSVSFRETASCIPVALLVFPLGGMIYSLPLAFLCRGKQPWCSLLLAGCLFATVWAIGTWTGMNPEKIRLSWYWSLAAYALLLCGMGIRNVIEPFFAAHMFCILITVFIGTYSNITRAKVLKEKARAEQVGPKAAFVPLTLPCPAA